MFTLKIIQLLCSFVYSRPDINLYKKYKNISREKFEFEINQFYMHNSADNHFFIISLKAQALRSFIDRLNRYFDLNLLKIYFMRLCVSNFFHNTNFDTFLYNLQDYIICVLNDFNMGLYRESNNENPSNFYKINFDENNVHFFTKLNKDGLIDDESSFIDIQNNIGDEENATNDYLLSFIKQSKFFILKNSESPENLLSSVLIAKTLIHELKKFKEKKNSSIEKNKVYFIIVFNSNLDDYIIKNLYHYKFFNILIENITNDDKLYFGNNKLNENKIYMKNEYDSEYRYNIFEFEKQSNYEIYKKNFNLITLLESKNIKNNKSVIINKTLDNRKLKITFEMTGMNYIVYKIYVELEYPLENNAVSKLKIIESYKELNITLKKINCFVYYFLFAPILTPELINSNIFTYIKSVDKILKLVDIDELTFLKIFWFYLILFLTRLPDNIYIENIYFFDKSYLLYDFNIRNTLPSNKNLEHFKFTYFYEYEDDFLNFLEKNLIENIEVAKIEFYIVYKDEKNYLKGFFCQILHRFQNIKLTKLNYYLRSLRTKLIRLIHPESYNFEYGSAINKKEYEKVYNVLQNYLYKSCTSVESSSDKKSLKEIHELFNKNSILNHYSETKDYDSIRNEISNIIIREISEFNTKIDEKEIIRTFLEILMKSIDDMEYENTNRLNVEIKIFGEKEFLERRDFVEFFDKVTSEELFEYG